MLRRLHAARRLGGLAAALPRAAEPLEALHAVFEPGLWRAAAAHEALRSEGCCRSDVTRTLGVPRGFAAAAGGGDEPVEPPVAAAPPPERESSAARGDADGDAASPDASEARAPTRAKRASHNGIRGEKTASGQPKPDVRTVARLVQLGWCDTAEAAEAMLTKRKGSHRYAFDTAGPAIDWLLNTLGDEKHSSGRCLAAHAIYRIPLLLVFSTSALQRGWEVVTLSQEAGGLGLSEKVARRRVATNPAVLAIASQEFLQKRASFLETLGVPDGRAAIARHFQMLHFAEKTLRSKVEWMRSQGLDIKRIVSSQPSLLTCSAKGLSPKLDFMLNVVGLDLSQIEPRFFTGSSDNVLRPRLFYAMQREVRYAYGTLVKCSDAAYLKRVHCLEKPASMGEIAAYKAHIASPAFCAYMDEQEQAIRMRGPRIEQ